MLARRPLVATALLALLVTGAVPLPEAEAQSGREQCPMDFVRYLACIEPLHADPSLGGITHNLYAIAWRPVPNPLNGLHEALIVGGIPGEFAVGLPVRSLVLLYDGVRVSKIFDKEGPQFVDVAWAPDGSYALVVSNRKAIMRVDPPQPGHPQYDFTNLWDDCSTIEVVNCEQAPFFGHQVAFNPVEGYAWITGSSLLQYDGEKLTVVDAGTDIAWRAIGWNPQGDKAMLSALVCVDPSDTGSDVPCVGNITQNKVVPGRIIIADTATNKLCEVFTYGQFDVQKAEVNGVTWSPGGDYAFIYGDDNFHGTILKFDALKPATGTTDQGCPRLRDSFSWMPFVKDEGEFNDMAYHAKTGRYWAAAGAGKELWEGNASTFLDVLGEHDITGGKGTIYYGVAWDPTDTYLLISGFAGKLYKLVPATHPFTVVTTPKSNTFVTDTVLVAGRAFSPTLFVPVQRVEVRITGPEGATDWMPANLTGRFRTLTNWTFNWDTLAVAPGVYQVSARAWIDLNVSNISNRTVQVVRSGGLVPPAFVDPPLASPTGNYSLRWTASPGEAIVYELEEAGLASPFGGASGGQLALTQDFAFAGDERLLYNGTAPAFEVTERKDGQYFYRVRVRGPNAVSPWSPPLPVVVAIDSDGDGFADRDEINRGANPNSATSSPDDLDGDGCPNREDAFQFDPGECKDSDGDGTGDKADAYPLDPREVTDADKDAWGDNAERRLGANPFDPASTPESDDDLDGCLNKDEAAAGTNPKDASSADAVCAIARPGGPGAAPTPGFEALALLAAAGLVAALRRRRP